MVMDVAMAARDHNPYFYITIQEPRKGLLYSESFAGFVKLTGKYTIKEGLRCPIISTLRGIPFKKIVF
jgi:hypothetical protein